MVDASEIYEHPNKKITKAMVEIGEKPGDADLFSDFWTPDTIEYQADLRTLAEALDIPYFNSEADINARTYYSRDRLSRTENCYMVKPEKSEPYVIAAGALGSEAAPPEEKRGFLARFRK